MERRHEHCHSKHNYKRQSSSGRQGDGSATHQEVFSERGDVRGKIKLKGVVRWGPSGGWSCPCTLLSVNIDPSWPQIRGLSLLSFPPQLLVQTNRRHFSSDWLFIELLCDIEQLSEDLRGPYVDGKRGTDRNANWLTGFAVFRA